MQYNKVNIGLLIEQKANELGVTKAELARRLGLAAQNISRSIYERETLSADKIMEISEALNYDFFQYYRPVGDIMPQKATANNNSVAAINSEVTLANDTHTSERIKLLEQLLEEKERTINILLGR